MATVHIIGAGLAGLACALELSGQGRRIVIHEAARRAGGRCRSFHDAQLDCVIDNGNHLLLSANHAALAYLKRIGAEDTLMGPPKACFPFVDVATGRRWTITPSAGPIPWWVLSKSKRVPDTRLADYASALRLVRARTGQRIGDLVATAGPLWERFWEPLTLAALNTEAAEGDAGLLALVLRETFAKGAAACRPLIARDGLAASLVDPAVETLAREDTEIQYGSRLRALALQDDRVATLDFGDGPQTLEPEDRVVLAVPPVVARQLLPALEVPEGSRAIVNAHFRLPRPAAGPEGSPFLGIISGHAHWLFLRGEIASITVSAATGLVDMDNDRVVDLLWRDTARALDLPLDPCPPCRIIKEKRATFLQTPEEVARRPDPRAGPSNLVLAGDWTDTGFPATIEGAIRSGVTAAGILRAAG